MNNFSSYYCKVDFPYKISPIFQLVRQQAAAHAAESGKYPELVINAV